MACSRGGAILSPQQCASAGELSPGQLGRRAQNAPSYSREGRQPVTSSVSESLGQRDDLRGRPILPCELPRCWTGVTAVVRYGLVVGGPDVAPRPSGAWVWLSRPAITPWAVRSGVDGRRSGRATPPRHPSQGTRTAATPRQDPPNNSIHWTEQKRRCRGRRRLDGTEIATTRRRMELSAKGVAPAVFAVCPSAGHGTAGAARPASCSPTPGLRGR
jgi:hypothetical protein